MAGRFTTMNSMFGAMCLGLSATVVAACGPTSPTSDTPTVAVALFPLEEIARRVGGSSISVVSLTPTGVDAHSTELTAKQLDALEDSDLVLYVGDDFQPSIEGAIRTLDSSVATIDFLDHVDLIDASADHESADHEHGAHDPHVWLDPRNMQEMVRVVSTAIEALVGDADAASVRSNAQDYIEELGVLDDEMNTGLTECGTRTLVTSHDAFGYLASRYSLTTMSVTGLNPDEDPSARQLEDLADAARNAGVRTIFFEAMLPRDLADTVARTIGASTDILNPIEGISTSDKSAGATYASMQRDNLRRLRIGLRCA